MGAPTRAPSSGHRWARRPVGQGCAEAHSRPPAAFPPPDRARRSSPLRGGAQPPSTGSVFTLFGKNPWASGDGSDKRGQGAWDLSPPFKRGCHTSVCVRALCDTIHEPYTTHGYALNAKCTYLPFLQLNLEDSEGPRRRPLPCRMVVRSGYHQRSAFWPQPRLDESPHCSWSRGGFC